MKDIGFQKFLDGSTEKIKLAAQYQIQDGPEPFESEEGIIDLRFNNEQEKAQFSRNYRDIQYGPEAAKWIPEVRRRQHNAKTELDRFSKIYDNDFSLKRIEESKNPVAINHAFAIAANLHGILEAMSLELNIRHNQSQKDKHYLGALEARLKELINLLEQNRKFILALNTHG